MGYRRKHGRLIDADALLAGLEVDPVECPGCPEPEFLSDFRALIKEAPTVFPPGYREETKMNRIKEYLKKNRITQIKLADAIGIDPHTLGHYVRGYVAPRIDVAQEMCRVLHTTMVELFPDEEYGNRCHGCAHNGIFKNAAPCVGCSRRYSDQWEMAKHD